MWGYRASERGTFVLCEQNPLLPIATPGQNTR